MSRIGWRISACAALLLAAAGSAPAAEEAAPGEAGMPQIDPTWFPTQIVWLAICFVVLYLLLRRFALPRIAEVLEERQERISGDLEKAEALKAEAEEVLAEYQRATEQARADAQVVLRQAGERMAAESSRRNAALAERLVAEIQAAENRIAGEREAAVRNIQAVSAEIAQAAARRLLDLEVGDEAAAAAVAGIAKDER